MSDEAKPVEVRYELGFPLMSRDGTEIVDVPWAEGVLTLSADDAARMFPDLYSGLSIGTPSAEGGQGGGRLIHYWDRTSMAIDARVTPRSGDER